jgi:flagellar hook protein FlgE
MMPVMLSVLNIAASGLSAASSRLNVTAGNIANSETAGYKAKQLNLTASANGVVPGAITADPTAGAIDPDGFETSNVDPVKETVDLMLEKYQYTASAIALKTGDKTLGTLLDVLAK